jgi:AraC family transcriptional regulator
MFAFMEWLPLSEYAHARAPEMEVYFPGNDGVSEESYCEFWLPIVERSRDDQDPNCSGSAAESVS